MKIPALLATVILSTPLLAQVQPPAWPEIMGTPAGVVTVYEPQVDAFSQNTLGAHAAVSFVPTGQTTPIFGALWVKATVQTDRDARTVQLLSTTVTNSRFPQADAAQVAAITQAVGQNTNGFTLSLDKVLASLAQTQKQASASANFNNAPPQILYSDVPAVLVTLDGQPQMQPAGTGLMRVVNTPFFIVLDPSSGTYYLRGPGTWLSAANVMGPWESSTNPPVAVTTLAAQTKTAGTAGETDAMESGAMPKIIVATQPTELIQTDGAADFSTIPGTSLLYVSNTESDVFMEINTQALYVLLAGRWFTASSKAGPWTFVAPDQLPPDFASIPAGSPKADVLASVAGSTLADNAVMDASVPQTAAVPRNTPGPDVKYDGDPNFQPIPETSLQYAANTDAAVVNVDGTYYCCSEGVWFVGPSPAGPWTVANSVPDAVYTIPPTCPIYNVTYCYVYDSTPDVIYCGYLPGYVGSYVWGGTVIYGTGWPYSPWVGGVYIPRPATWGFAAVFNPVTCGWGFSVGTGWGSAAFGVGMHSGWWGVGGWNNNAWRSNNTVNINRGVTVNNTNVTNNIYNRNTNRVVNNNTVNRVNVENRTVNTSIKNTGVNRPRNDVYAGNDGNVYRSSLDGWQQHSNGNWNTVNNGADRDAFRNNVQPQLNRDFSTRSSGGYYGGGRGGGGGRR